MGGLAERIWLSHHLLALVGTLVSGWNMGAHLAFAAGPVEAAEKIEWAQAFLDGSFIPAKKGDLVSERHERVAVHA